ncbi:MAG: FAD-dependent monooxygenase [Maritimibacter sp.]
MLIGQEITIVGGGIGGFAAATALALRGAKVTVLEQAPEISEVGAGLQIGQNGMAVLKALGLDEIARERSMQNQAIRLMDGLSGKEVIRLDLEKHRPNQDFRLFHRADLLDVLETAAREAGVVVETGAKLTRVDVSESSAKLTIEGKGEREVPFVIGADGLHSLVREELNGPKRPFFTNQVAWRALIPADGTDPSEATVWMGPHRHMVTYPLRGGSVINLVAVEERQEWVEESWNRRDDPDHLRAAFIRYSKAPRALLDRVETVHVWGLFRHEVAAKWHMGRAAILGDAAHPTLPFMAQGAVMALEDAWVLAESLAANGLNDGPALYQAYRRARAVRIVEAANKNARNYHHANPVARFIGFNGLRVMGRTSPNTVLERFDWLYNYDVTKA